MQKCIYIFIILLALNLESRSQSEEFSVKNELHQADSLFNTKKYTQALKLYNQVFKNGLYSPAMLLRMGYIQEGLGHIGESLYFLNSYFGVTNDSQALKKMDEIAKRNHLEGYKFNEATQFLFWVRKQHLTIALSLASLILLTFVFVIYQRLRLNKKPRVSGILTIGLLLLLFLHLNTNKPKRNGVVTASNTYLMNKPSAGGDVIEIIGEGHKVEIDGKEDVWFRVIWRGEKLYAKEFCIKPIRP